MEIRKTLYVTNREEWRAWLTKHYQSETEVWLIYYKKHTGRPRISYEHAVEEALCFGWIDSIAKRMDDEKFAQKFTPRRDCTKWSELNKRRVRKLISEGRMTEAGLAKIDLAMLGKEAETKQSKDDDLDIPRFVKQALMANSKAWENFRNLTPSRRRIYLQLILDAKKEETRGRRLREVISLLEQSKGEMDDIPRFVKQALTASPKAWEYSKAWRRPIAGTTSGGSCRLRRRRRASGGCAKLSRSWNKTRSLALSNSRLIYPRITLISRIVRTGSWGKKTGGTHMTKPEISSVAPFFIVNDGAAALSFYRDRLGFDITFQEPADEPFFGIVCRGGAMIMLKDVGVAPLPNYKREPAARWDAYFSVPDPDALAAEFASRNVEFSEPLKDTHDGLRGFELKDADGYVLFFGRPRPKVGSDVA